MPMGSPGVMIAGSSRTSSPPPRRGPKPPTELSPVATVDGRPVALQRSTLSAFGLPSPTGSESAVPA